MKFEPSIIESTKSGFFQMPLVRLTQNPQKALLVLFDDFEESIFGHIWKKRIIPLNNI